MLKKFLLSLLVLVLGGGLALMLTVERAAAVNVDKLISQAMASGEYQEISYDSVNVNLNGSIDLHDLKVVDKAGQAYLLHRTTLSELDAQNDIPHALRVEVDGISFPNGLPQPEDANPLLYEYLQSQMQGQRLPLVVSYAYRYRPEQDHEVSNHASLKLADQGELEMFSTVRNIPIDALLAGPPEDSPMAPFALMGQAGDMEIPQFSLHFRDGGAVATLLDLQAAKVGMNAQDLQQLLLSQIQSLAMFMPPALSNLGEQVALALGDFLEGDKTFSVALQPDHDGNLRRLQPELMASFFTGDYDRIVSLLNLEITTD